MDYHLLFNIPLCFSCLSYYLMERLLKTFNSLSVLAFSQAAAAGINATAAAPQSCCKGEEILLQGEIDIPISQKTPMLAPSSSIRPEVLSLLSGGSFSAGAWTDHCPVRMIISVLWRSKTPCQKKNVSVEVENSDDIFNFQEIRKKYSKKSYKTTLLSPFFLQE